MYVRKKCSRCDVEKEPTEFTKDKSQTTGLSRWCKTCKSLSDKRFRCEKGGDKKEDYELINRELFKNEKKRNRTAGAKPSLGSLNVFPRKPTLPARDTPEGRKRERNYAYKKKYKISLDDYNEMYSNQNGKCLICTNEFKSLFVDHCHVTGKVRGLLCSTCNSGIGFLKDDIEMVRSALTYLES